jgi:hypothetical protein
MDHRAPSPLLDDEVYGLSNLCWSQQITGCVEKIGQQWWGLDAPAHLVNDREEENREEEEYMEDDEPIGNFDVASDEGLEGYEDDDHDHEMFAGSGQEGISLWDSLGKGFFERGISIRGKASG